MVEINPWQGLDGHADQHQATRSFDVAHAWAMGLCLEQGSATLSSPCKPHQAVYPELPTGLRRLLPWIGELAITSANTIPWAETP